MILEYGTLVDEMCVKLELISIGQGCQDSMRQIPLSIGMRQQLTHNGII